MWALSPVPASAHEVMEVLKQKNVRTDLATIYRTLDLFGELGLVEKIQFGDKTARYELTAGQTHHHHHLICDNCGKVEDIPLDEKVLTGQIEEKSKFKVDRHSLEFFGMCVKCQK